tara:strand:- start:77 stop:280 length:204 start_codon:yes stop_codon:yes gene_type:complete
MNELNSINGGYKGGSPRVRSTNTKTVTPPPPPTINVDGMVESIKEWHADGKLSKSDIQQLISELNKI